MQGYKMEKLKGTLNKDKFIEDNFNKFDFFETTKDFELNDSSFVKKGTEFRIDSFNLKENKYEIHFETNTKGIYGNYDDENVYTYDLKNIKEFAKPTEFAIEEVDNMMEADDLMRDEEIKEPTEWGVKIPNKEEIYTTKEINKVDKAKGNVHIYQFNDEPKKCFIGQKTDNGIKKLGAIAPIKEVKQEFKEFKEFEKKQNPIKNTLVKDRAIEL